jgi:hypothetical protein
MDGLVIENTNAKPINPAVREDCAPSDCLEFDLLGRLRGKLRFDTGLLQADELAWRFLHEHQSHWWVVYLFRALAEKEPADSVGPTALGGEWYWSWWYAAKRWQQPAHLEGVHKIRLLPYRSVNTLLP